jgi:tetratricopeptide (TPR) repeat protein
MTLLVEALSHHQAGRLAEAATLYQSVLTAEPHNPDALYLLGILARQAQHPETAIKLIRQAIDLREGVAQFHNHLGAALLDIGDRDAARKSFMRALQLQPRYLDALLNLANLLAEGGQVEEAATCYRAALRLHPDQPETARRLAVLETPAQRAKPARSPVRAAPAAPKAAKPAPSSRPAGSTAAARPAKRSTPR